MTIALFLIPYTLFLIIWAFLSVFAVYHLIEFGVGNFTTFSATFTYIALSIIILFLSFTTFGTIQWSTPIFTTFSIILPS